MSGGTIANHAKHLRQRKPLQSHARREDPCNLFEKVLPHLPSPVDMPQLPKAPCSKHVAGERLAQDRVSELFVFLRGQQRANDQHGDTKPRYFRV